jgi:SAM-dependent methyltransferase
MSVSFRCLACGSTRSVTSYVVPDHEYDVGHTAEYGLCEGCGTLLQTPIPDLEQLATFYPPRYHSFAAGGLLARLKDRARLRRLRSLLASNRGVILDYGCGDGRFIKEAAMRTKGLVFWGYEMAARRQEYVAPDGRVTIIHGSVDDLLAVLPACDLVTMNHVIEHLPDPLAVLRALHARMNDGATMEGQTPAADSLERKVFRTRWSGFHAPRHTVIFSRSGLQQVLTAAGFHHPEIAAAFNPAGIAVSLASVPHGDCPGTITRQGAQWLMYVGAAAALHPIELLSGAPGIVNYAARKAMRSPGASSP